MDTKGKFDSKPDKILRVLGNHSKSNVVQRKKYNTMTAVLFTGLMCRTSFSLEKKITSKIFFPKLF